MMPLASLKREDLRALKTLIAYLMYRSSIMSEVTTFRLYLLRAAYVLIVVGLGIQIWPEILFPPENPSHMGSVVTSVLGAVSLLAILGIRYPLKMLPLLFFEILWKGIWVLVFGLPPDPSTQGTLFACLMGLVLFPLVIPWGYVFRHYLRAAGDRWGRRPASIE